jgi:predicted PurR-regulated permease PerM
MLPLCNWLENHKVPRGLAIVICIVLMYLLVAGIVTLLSFQIMAFAEDLPQLKTSVTTKFHSALVFVEQHFGVKTEEQMVFLQEKMNSMSDDSSAYVKTAVLSTTGIFAGVAIVTVLIIFFLIYRERFKIFVLKLVSAEEHSKAKTVMHDVSKVTQQYLTGVFTVMVILATLNSVGLLIIGIKHAIFFGVVAAILNIIPYIGVFIGSLLPILMAFITKDSIVPAVAVMGLFFFNQMLENNVLTPKITGSKVKINPLATLLAIIIGGQIWGVAGMILFIPLLGIVKIICDNIEPLAPYGYLIGDDKDATQSGFVKRVKEYFRKKKIGAA